MKYNTIRPDHEIILGQIEAGASVLDLGCGKGDLLQLLIKEKMVRAQGIEKAEEDIYSCVEKGLAVFHGDIDTGLSEYGDNNFDYVVLNQSFQQVTKPDLVLQEALRVGKKVIVGFPNFVYLPARLQFFFLGRTPLTPSLPYRWYDTPNLHFLSILDFTEYCSKRKIKVLRSYFIRKKKRINLFPNLLAETGLFVLTK
ncbi:MAG: methionine biosynthesis protein MetW [Candidatus Margulisiibacteriota bacterium]